MYGVGNEADKYDIIGKARGPDEKHHSTLKCSPIHCYLHSLSALSVTSELTY